MKIRPKDRHKLIYYLNEFYKKYPYEKYTIFHFVKYFKRRLKNNKDAWMAVNGDTGTGKSYMVLMSQILFGRPFSLVDNVTYIPKGNEIIDKFNNLNFQTLLIDEAAKEMRAVNWQSKQQQMVNVKAMTDRFKNNWVFLNIPNFNEFTKSMRLGNIIFRAIVIYRTDLYARVIIQRKSRNWRDEDPWNDKIANDRYKKMEKKYGELTNEMILKVERGFPNTLMDFIIPNLELVLPNVTNEYQRLKLESREVDKKQMELTKPDRYRKLYSKIMTRVSKLLVYNELNLGKVQVSKREIADALGVSSSTLNDYLKKAQTNIVSKVEHIPKDSKLPNFKLLGEDNND